MRQHLVIDGDDTLWENNVHFERAIEEFIDFLAHSAMSREQVRAALDEIERLNIANHGYGSAAFAKNLHQTYNRLADRAILPDDLERVLELGRRVADHPMELLPGVEETLEYLSERHDLTLFTKGSEIEQRPKVERSGLEHHFARVVITPEKDERAYRELVAAGGFDPELTWMIGNSPRSDINPALAAGIRAVFIPHPMTWSLEVADLVQSDRLLAVDRFADLREHF